MERLSRNFLRRGRGSDLQGVPLAKERMLNTDNEFVRLLGALEKRIGRSDDADFERAALTQTANKE